MLRYYIEDEDKIYVTKNDLYKRFIVKTDNELIEKIYELRLNVYCFDICKLKMFKNLENNKNELVYDYRCYKEVLKLKLGKQEL